MVLLAPYKYYDQDEDLKAQLRSVIITRSKEGATIEEIIGTGRIDRPTTLNTLVATCRMLMCVWFVFHFIATRTDDYKELTGKHLLAVFFSRNVLAKYLSELENVWCTTDSSCGLLLWFCSTPKTKHVVHMIQQQRSPRASRRTYRQYIPRALAQVEQQELQDTRSTEIGSTGLSNAFNAFTYGEPMQSQVNNRPGRSYRYKRPPRMVRHNPYARRTTTTSQQSTGWRQSRSDELDYSMYGPSYHRHQLVGDDFFLAIAKWELGFSFDRGHQIDMSGLCISGLTLSEAAKRVEVAPFIADHVLVNVGTVDLLHGREMIDLIHDFDQLVARFRERNVEPIMTTLAPIANSGGRTPMAERLLKLNEYMCRTCPRTIDLWKNFVHANGTVRFECYQPGPRKVSGSIMPHVLWNKLGRQLMLGVLGNEIATQLTTDEQWRYY